MKVREIIEDVKGSGTVMEEETMLYCLDRFEREIADYMEKEYKEIDMESKLSAPKQFFIMYREYLMRENALRNEDWDCYQMHNTIFLTSYSEFKKFVVRNAEPKEQSYKNNWRW